MNASAHYHRRGQVEIKDRIWEICNQEVRGLRLQKGEAKGRERR